MSVNSGGKSVIVGDGGECHCDCGRWGRECECEGWSENVRVWGECERA